MEFVSYAGFTVYRKVAIISGVTGRKADKAEEDAIWRNASIEFLRIAKADTAVPAFIRPCTNRGSDVQRTRLLLSCESKALKGE
jgi:hypothetical protein